MTESAADRLRRALPFVVPLIFLPALYFEARVAWLAVHASLGRDQGIFQYVAYALSSGQKDYVDLHEINGPFVHLLGLVLYKVGGLDELRFRALDFGASAVVFFAAGMAIPGIGWTKGDAPTPARWGLRLVWGLAGSALLWAQYLKYTWWDHAQRESFYDLFIVAALAAQLVAHAPSTLSRRSRLLLWGLSGALGLLPSYGKPTCGLYFLGQLLALWLDHDAPLLRRERLRAFFIGVTVGAIPVVVFVALYADVGAMMRMVFVDGPRLYRHIWHRSVTDGWSWGNAARLNYGLITLATVAPLIWLRLLPRRTWAAVFFLVGAILNYFLQAKLFPYHLHPITCAAFLMWLIIMGVLVERGPRALVRFAQPKVAMGLAIVAAAFLSWHCTQEVTLSDTAHEMTPDRLLAASTYEKREHELPRFYNGGSTLGGIVGTDYYAWDMRRAGWFVRDATDPSDRVQTWGMDPYVLVFAQRLAASPFLYSFEVNVDAALAGGEGGVPSASEAQWLRDKGAANAHALFEDAQRRNAGAFIVFDNQPFLHPQDGDEDFRVHCPEAHAFMREHYTRVRRFGAVRVWLRNDLAAKVPPLPPGSPEAG